MSALQLLIEALIPLLLVVESSNGTDLRAYERGRHAAGPLQITRLCVEEVNRKTGSTWSWPDDCFDMQNSREICIAYLRLTAPERPSLRRLALIWRYGPTGALRGDPAGYWDKIKDARAKQAGRRVAKGADHAE